MAAFFPSKRTAWAVVLDCNEMDKTRIFAENRGFTLAELVIIILLIGILAVFVAPRMLDVTSTKAAAFADKLRADIRYTQNAAMTANRRYRVYVNTAPAPVPNGYIVVNDLDADGNWGAGAGEVALDPAGGGNLVLTLNTGDYAGITVSTPPGGFVEFNALGTPTGGAVTITILGNLVAAATVTIAAQTGAVN